MALLDDFKDLEKETPKDKAPNADNPADSSNSNNKQDAEHMRGYIPTLNNKGTDGNQIHRRYSQDFYNRLNGKTEPKNKETPESK